MSVNITIKEVAKEANVSIATVSRALNRKGNVAAETIAKVEAAVKKLSYTPNFLALGLRNQKTHRILAIVSSISRGFYADVFAGMEKAANEHGYSILVVTNNDDPKQELEHLELLFARAVDGVVLLAPKLDAVTINKISVNHNITICLERLEGCGALTVTIDNVRAGKDAVDYLVRKGHRRIGMLSTAHRTQSSVDREAGYIQSLKENNLPFNQDYIYLGDYGYDSGVKGCLHLLGLSRPPTAVFCISDLMAFGAMNIAEELGKRIGKNLMFVGFDNSFFSGICKPRLSTIEQPYVLQGKIAVEKLISNINETNFEKRDSNLYELPHRLILRLSSND
jgi:LacI family transcriptional regulator/LacI family repressor for deo operon, udp, cdd, tsx, nupC, and nupG